MFKCITLREWQHILKDEKNLIVQASNTDGNDTWENFPIGMCWQYNMIVREKCLQINNHKNLVLCSINTYTDFVRRGTQNINRKKIVKTLKENNISNYSVNYNKYFKLLPQYKFVISPEGNGIDCHRHYEALLAGCIPIVEWNENIQNKYGNCPILYTKDYSEITEEYLIKKYEEMLDKEYNFERLFLDYYNDKEVERIYNNSDYWTLKLTQKKYYQRNKNE